MSRNEESHFSVVLYTPDLIHQLVLGTEGSSARQTLVSWKLIMPINDTWGVSFKIHHLLISSRSISGFLGCQGGLFIALTKSPWPQVLYGEVLQHAMKYSAGTRDAIVPSHSWMEDVEDTSAVSDGESGARYYIHVNLPFFSNSLFRATFSCPSP